MIPYLCIGYISPDVTLPLASIFAALIACLILFARSLTDRCRRFYRSFRPTVVRNEAGVNHQHTQAPVAEPSRLPGHEVVSPPESER